MTNQMLISYQNTHIWKWVLSLDAGEPLNASLPRFPDFHWHICLTVNSWLLLFFVKSFHSGLDESVLEECLQYLEKQLENSQVRKAMEEFLSFGYLLIWLNYCCCYYMHPKRHIFLPLCSVFPSGELVQIMMATANENLSAKFCNRVLKFFTKLFQLSKLYIMSFTLQKIKTCLNCIVLSSWHLNACYILLMFC